MPWCVLCYVGFRKFIAVYLHNHNHNRLLQLSLTVHCLFKCNSSYRLRSAGQVNRSVHNAALYTSVNAHNTALYTSVSAHNAALYPSVRAHSAALYTSISVHSAALHTSVRPDIQIGICHCALVWVLLWTGTEVNPVCGNVVVRWKVVTFFSWCHFGHLTLNFNFDQFSVTACSFLRISVLLLKHLFWFQPISDWIMAFSFLNTLRCDTERSACSTHLPKTAINISLC
jgi:hypothetical protein